MPEMNKDKQLFTVARVFFLLIVIPLSLMAFLIANGMFKLGVTAKEKAVDVVDKKSQEDIKARAVNTANEIASFLMESKKDLQIATIIPASGPAAPISRRILRSIMGDFILMKAPNVPMKDGAGMK